ncbi:hypothetical protein EDD86DRAFT_245356 [Gorgonomyces haynaldii]|nr:hypothetical protein EDD86DRAFT_245356 [Gorgonomyces haynaldii]
MIEALTKLAMKHKREYKLVVHAIEKFAIKCKPEHKLSCVYVIDSICRTSMKTDGPYVKRFEEKLGAMFSERMKRVTQMWQQLAIFGPDLMSTIDEALKIDKKVEKRKEQDKPSDQSERKKEKQPDSSERKEKPKAEPKKEEKTEEKKPREERKKEEKRPKEFKPPIVAINPLGVGGLLNSVIHGNQTGQSPTAANALQFMAMPERQARDPSQFDYGDDDDHITQQEEWFSN